MAALPEWKRENHQKQLLSRVLSFVAVHFHPNVQKIPPIGKCAYRLHMYVCLISAGFLARGKIGVRLLFQMALFPLPVSFYFIFRLIELLRALFIYAKTSSN